MTKELDIYKLEMEEQLSCILDYWIEFATDKADGGYFGKIDHFNEVYPESAKGSVLHSRILWSFSAAYNLTKKEVYKSSAEWAFSFINSHFIDKDFGGVFWLVDHKGAALNTKKQIYALAFAVYGLSEYYKCSADKNALDLAIAIYESMVQHSYDKIHGGYIEALTRDWKEMGDIRLSAKDANERKSMNTHLHVLEGLANLYTVWPDENLRYRIREVIDIFLNHIIDNETGHLILFFDDEWNIKSSSISYGHDIEAAWLIQEAAEIIGHRQLIQEVKEKSILMADAAALGLDKDGGLWYEYEPACQRLVRQKHSWPQAEAMVGFFNAWQISGKRKYLQLSLNSWGFVKNCILDRKGGEWVWGVYDDYSPMKEEDKVGIWKCPYHNSRACMEIIRRIARASK
jgi:mannobiose 2-epimerase